MYMTLQSKEADKINFGFMWKEWYMNRENNTHQYVQKNDQI